MILGVLVGKKTYHVRKYFFVFLIVIGVVLFMYKEKSGNKTAESGLGLGELLLLLSLSMDGLTGAIQVSFLYTEQIWWNGYCLQERMKAETQPTAQQMMKNMNLWSSLILAGALIVTGEAFQFVDFVTRYPVVVSNVALLALAGAIGQLFIFLMVSVRKQKRFAIIKETISFFRYPILGLYPVRL